MRKFMSSLFAFGLICLCSTGALAAANYVYHEQSGNNTDQTRNAGTPGTCGKFVDNTDRSASGGFQIYSPESYTLRFKVEFQFFTNRVAVFYTTDGTNPSTATSVVGGITDVNPANASTNELTASYTCVFPDGTLGGQPVDVATATIPPQPVGTTVKYIVVAWHSGGGDVTYGNSGPGGGFNCNASSCATVHTYSVLAAPATPLIISEFRTFGPTGTCDEFVEIYNNSNSTVTVAALDGSAGFALAHSNGNVVFTIPNTTNIPPRGHFLAVNSGGGSCTGSFSGSGYPGSGTATPTNGDTTMNEDIPSNVGIALFNTSNQANFNLTNRLDAVGSTTEANTLYVEGTGYPPINPNTNSYSLYRDARSGLPQDTNNNEMDFDIANTAASTLCADTANFQCQRLGAPGPENLASPVQRNDQIKASLVDIQCSSIAVNPVLPSACRFERRTNAGSGYGSSPTSTGTLSIRRRFTNTTGTPVTRLRFRIVDITTVPEGQIVGNGIADLRAITSASVTATCQSEGGTPHLCSDNASPTTTIEGTTLETDANGQPNGGAFNSTLSLATPLAAGASVNVQFLLGVERNGRFRFFINVEALPAPPSASSAVAAGAATKAQATGKQRAVRGVK